MNAIPLESAGTFLLWCLIALTLGFLGGFLCARGIQKR